jgi:hypothetical protein
VLERIVVEGAELNIELKKHESELAREEEASGGGTSGGANAGAGAAADQESVTEEYTVERYEPYLDPFYVSPVWLGLWLL